MNNDFLTRINNDINGNPRFVVHFLKFNEDYVTALNLAKLLGGKVYRGKQYGGCFVFQSYADYLCLDIVCMKHIFDAIDVESLKDYLSYNPKKSMGVNLESIIKQEKSSYLVNGRLTGKICEDWLRGCPSLVNNEYFDNSIIELLEYNGIKTEYQNEERLVNLFWFSCGNALFKLCGGKL